MRNIIADHMARKTTGLPPSMTAPEPEEWTKQEKLFLADKVIESIREVLFIGADGLRSQDHRPEFVDAKAVAVSLMKFVCLLTELEIADKLEKSPRGVYLLVAKAQAAMTDQNPRNELQQKILRVRDHLLLELESLDPN